MSFAALQKLSYNLLVSLFSLQYQVAVSQIETAFYYIFRVFSITAVKMVEIATFEEIKDLPNHPEKLLIDVREPNELVETGKIPTSINIPRKFNGLYIKYNRKTYLCKACFAGAF